MYNASFDNPKLSLTMKVILSTDSIEYYEERQMYHLLMANDPSFRIIYFTSNYVDEKVVRYYLGLSQDEESGDCRGRLDSTCDVHNKLTRVFMINVTSTQHIPLSDKIVEDSKCIKFVKGLICQRQPAHLVNSAGLSVFTGSDSADKISRKLGRSADP